jgi:phospholipid/cholesterol/gamma-HCH transport system permease protein
MRERADFTVTGDDPDAGRTLAVEGALCMDSLAGLDARLEQFDGELEAIDLSRVTDIDTTGAWLISHFANARDIEITGASGKAQRLFKAIGSVEPEEEAQPHGPPSLSRRTLGEVGDRVIDWGTGFVTVIGFLGSFIVSFGATILRPARWRPAALVHHMQYIGVNSLWIVGLMSFLIGIVIAQQGAVQLAQFGAEIYTINLTGRLAMRELGILMTAIMVAGRSGSAFAAQIGTMKLTEEVDAMRTIGVSPMEALVVPRVLATMIMMPLLGFYSAVLAIVGGAAISNFALDIPFWAFIQRTQEVVPITDVWIGLIKAPVFALIVALAGCHQGMQVKGNAEEVGLRTTQAVVTAIFTVIVLDAFFAIFFTEIGWT